MHTLTKRIVATLAVLAAASAPSVAYARPNLDNGQAPATPTVDRQAIQNAPAPTLRLAVHNETAPSRPAVNSATAPSARGLSASPQGFRWDDAGLGAAATLVLIGVGSGAAFARRRWPSPLAG